MTFKKIFCLIISLILMLPAMSSCGSENTVMSIHGFNVPYNVFRYVFLNTKEDMISSGCDFSSDKDYDTLMESVTETLIKVYSVRSLAEEYGISGSDDEIRSDVLSDKEALIEELETGTSYEDELKKNFMDDEVYEFFTATDHIIDAVFLKIAEKDKEGKGEDYLREIFAGDSFIRVKQILFSSGTDEENLEKANDILARLEAGFDFDELAKGENDDLFMFGNDDGYYIMEGSRDREFEKAAFSLKIGEISGLVKTSAGYSVIKRYEKDPSYIDTHYEFLSQEYYETLYNVALEGKISGAAAEKTEYLEKMNLSDIK